MIQGASKVLVLGPPDGLQDDFVTSISKVKVRSSARQASGEGVIPMLFGRVPLGDGLDLQLFGAERDQAPVVLDAISKGLIGAIVLVEPSDTIDPHYAASALDELASRSIPTVVLATGSDDIDAALRQALNLGENLQALACHQVDREQVKRSLVAVLETALDLVEGVA